jgi:hypothetical protein
MDDDFASSVDRLEGAVRRACVEQDDWPARVAAGIRATVEFVVGDPASARTLTLDLKVEEPDPRQRPVIERFSRMLAAGTPPRPGVSPPVEKAVVGGIAAVIANHVRSERTDELAGHSQELIYFALMPYMGYEDAKRWVDESTAG